MRMPKGTCIWINGKPSSGAPIGVPANLLQLTQGARCTTSLYTEDYFSIYRHTENKAEKEYVHAGNY
jgi:hypothetical protein